MELTPQLAFQALGVLIAITSLTITLVNLANRRSRAFDVADGSLTLLKALRQDTNPDAPQETKETREALIERLEERAQYATQLYLGRTKPIVTHQRLAVIVFAAFAIYAVYFMAIPVFGLPQDVQQFLALLLLPIGLLVALSVSNRAFEYKRTMEALTEEVCVAARTPKLSRFERFRKRVEKIFTAAGPPVKK